VQLVQVQDVSQDCSIIETLQKKSISVASKVATVPNSNPEKEIKILQMATLKRLQEERSIKS